MRIRNRNYLYSIIIGLIIILSVPVWATEGVPKNNLKLAVVNFQPCWGDKSYNLDKMIQYVESAADEGAELILFPEMALTGYAMETGEDINRSERMQVKLAEKYDGPSAQAIAKIAKERNVYVVYGYPEIIGDDDPLNIYNSAVAIGPNGILGSYQKIQPFGSEVIWCKTGSTPFTFDTPWGPIGISICYDTYNYPELSRYYGAYGARLVLNPTATSRAYFSSTTLVDGQPVNDGRPYGDNSNAWLNRFKSRIEAVVIQSDIYVATANLVGGEFDKRGNFMGTCFPGGSCVIGPLNDNLGTPEYIGYYGTNPATAVEEEIIYSNIDLSTATRNSFVNYIDTDVQEGNLFNAELYAEWYKEIAKKMKTIKEK